MKKLFLLLLLLLLPACARAEAQPFAIDRDHFYEPMSRTYEQGYAPTVSDNRLTVVLPLLSDAADGAVTARIACPDPEVSPIRAQSLEKRFSRKDFTFGSEKRSAYLILLRIPLHGDRINGDYPLYVDVSGQSADGSPLQQRFGFTFTVSDGQPNPETPLLAVSEFSPSGAYLAAGEAAELHLTLTNRSRSRTIRAIRLTVADGAGDILPTGSDTVRIDALRAGESAALTLPVRVVRRATEGPHTLSVAMEYAFTGGTSAATEKFCVDVRQSVRLEYSMTPLAARLTEGDVAALPVTLMNMGQSELSNATICAELPGTGSGGVMLAGSIAPGESKSVSANLRVTGDVLGDVRGTLWIRYEDAYGERHEQAVALSTAIEPRPAAAAEPECAEQSSLPWPWICAAMGAVAAAALLVQGICYRKRLRHLEERDL